MGSNILITLMRYIITFITGDFGKTLCILLIIFSGVMWWFKKVNTGTALKIVGGTAIVYIGCLLSQNLFSTIN